MVDEHSSTSSLGNPVASNGDTDAKPDENSSRLWRWTGGMVTGAVGGAYNVGSGLAGAGLTGAKWAAGKGSDATVSLVTTGRSVGGSVASTIVAKGAQIGGMVAEKVAYNKKDKKE